MACNKFSSEAAALLFKTLKDIDAEINEINLSDNQLENTIITSLSEYVNGNKHLEKMNLELNELTNKAIERLATNINGNTTLKYLCLDYNTGITSRSIPDLMKIASTTEVEEIGTDGISMEGNSSWLKEYLEAKMDLKRKIDNISCSWQKLTDDFIDLLCELMEKFGIEHVKSIG